MDLFIIYNKNSSFISPRQIKCLNIHEKFITCGKNNKNINVTYIKRTKIDIILVPGNSNTPPTVGYTTSPPSSTMGEVVGVLRGG